MPYNNLSSVKNQTYDAGFGVAMHDQIDNWIKAGARKFEPMYMQEMEGGLTIFKADIKTNDHDIYYNGFRGVMIKDFKHITQDDFSTQTMIDNLHRPPFIFQYPDPGEFQKAIDSWTEKMVKDLEKLRLLDPTAFHVITGIFKDILPPADDALHQKMKQAVQDHTVARFFSRDEGTPMDKAHAMLRGNAVYVYLPRHKQPGTEKDEMDKKHKVGQWIQIDFSQPPNERGNYQKAFTYHDNYGFNLRDRLLDYRFPQLANEHFLDAVVARMENGEHVKLATDNQKFPEVTVSLGLEKLSLGIRGTRGFLSHVEFLTEDGKAKKEARDNTTRKQQGAKADQQEKKTNEEGLNTGKPKKKEVTGQTQ